MTPSDWAILACDAAILSLVASAYVMALVRLNPRLFLRHYPPEIRAAAPPATPQEKRLARLVGLPFIALLVGWPIWSSLQLAARNPYVGPEMLGLNAAAISMAFNVVDFAVLDVLWLGMLRPSWAMIPGAGDVAFRVNPRDHLRGFVVGSGLAFVLGALVTGVAMLGR